MIKLSAVAAAIVFAASAQAAVKPYSVLTAPDSVSREVLSRSVTRVDEGASPRSGADAQRAVHANFPQIIEQNFARLDQRGARSLVDGLSERELHDLAQLYVNAVNDGGQQAKLLDVFADRLDVGRLSRLSRHFGTNEIGAAVQRAAPLKAASFSMASPAVIAGPVLGAAIAAPALKAAAGRMATPMDVTGGIGRFLNMTPTEIYLDYRTAPVGSLGVTGALWETAVTISKGTFYAASAGWAVGTVVNDLLQTYKPELYDAIGGTIHEIVDPIIDSPLDSWQMGQALQNSSNSFGTSWEQSNDFGSFGGDFNIASEWASFGGGGGGGGGGGTGTGPSDGGMNRDCDGGHCPPILRL